MSKRPAFWIVYVLLAALAVWFAVVNFPRAFPIISLDLRMDRGAALRAADDLARRERWGPAGAHREAASFRGDDTLQTFVELAGGGKQAFRRMLDRGLYAAYTWRVRRFREGEKNETLVRFTPAGTPYGFVEKLADDAPGARLDPAAARRIAEDGARSVWHVDLAAFAPVEASQEVKSGRIDHTFVYERRAERLGEGRYRLRLVVSGDRLTQLTHFVKIPEAFSRRYEGMRAVNNAIALVAFVLAIVLYLVVGGGFGVFTQLRQRWLLWRQPLALAVVIALLQGLDVINSWPLAWMHYDTALSGRIFLLERVLASLASFVLPLLYLTLTFMAAEGLTRRAFPHHPQLWRLWSRDAGATVQVLGRTVGGYLFTGIELAYIVGFYLVVSRWLGWWTPSEALVDPDILSTYLPWLSAVAPATHAGVWEECLFRAVPLAGAALIGERTGRRKLWIGCALVFQALVFGGGHANYASEPAYSRLVELVLPAFVWGLIYLRYGLLPTMVMHFVFDLSLFSIPLFTTSSAGARIDQTLIVLCALVPLGAVLFARMRARRWGGLPESLRNRAWTPPPVAGPVAAPAAPVLVAPPLALARIALVAALGLAGLVAWAVMGRDTDAPRLGIGRASAREPAVAALREVGFTPSAKWKVLPTVSADPDTSHEFVWRTSGEAAYDSLLGSYLPPPRWTVRAVTFTGKWNERAEEWMAEVGGSGAVLRARHRLPQDRLGPALDEDSARIIARAAVRERLRLDPLALREISAKSTSLPARRDWTFSWADTASHALRQGQARLSVEIAGREVVDARRFVFVPEDWMRAYTSRQSVLQILSAIRLSMVGAVAMAGVVVAIVLWSRRRYPARIAWILFGVFAAAGVVRLVNNWPAIVARFSTAQPYDLQRATGIVASVVALLLSAAVLALFTGFAHGRALEAQGGGRRAPWWLGVATGCAVAGVVRVLSIAARREVPSWPDYLPAQALVPPLASALAPISGVLGLGAFLLTMFAILHRMTDGWTRQRLALGALLFLVAGLTTPFGSADTVALWVESVVLSGLLAVVAYAIILRFDLTLLPIVAGTIAALSGVRTIQLRPYPGAALGGALELIVAIVVATLWTRALRAGAAAETTTREAGAPSPAE